MIRPIASERKYLIDYIKRYIKTTVGASRKHSRKEGVPYQNLDHIGSKCRLISITGLKRLVPVLNALFMWKIDFEKKIRFFPLIKKFPSLVLSRNTIMSWLLIAWFSFKYPSLVAYGRLKRKEKFNFLALKLDPVAYERWSLTRGFKYNEVWLYYNLTVCLFPHCLYNTEWKHFDSFRMQTTIGNYCNW